jgi:hypothetical protein
MAAGAGTAAWQRPVYTLHPLKAALFSACALWCLAALEPLTLRPPPPFPFPGQVLAPLHGQSAEGDTHLREAVALLAYQRPEQSPLKGLLVRGLRAWPGVWAVSVCVSLQSRRHPRVSVTVCMRCCLSVCQPACLSACLLPSYACVARVRGHLPACLPVSLPVRPSVCPSVRPSVTVCFLYCPVCLSPAIEMPWLRVQGAGCCWALMRAGPSGKRASSCPSRSRSVCQAASQREAVADVVNEAMLREAAGGLEAAWPGGRPRSALERLLQQLVVAQAQLAEASGGRGEVSFVVVCLAFCLSACLSGTRSVLLWSVWRWHGLQAGRQVDRQMDKQTDGQTDRQAGGQADGRRRSHRCLGRYL